MVGAALVLHVAGGAVGIGHLRRTTSCSSRRGILLLPMELSLISPLVLRDWQGLDPDHSSWEKELGMDANHTAGRNRRFTFAAVVFVFVCTIPATRAGEPVQTPPSVPPASQCLPVQVSEQAGLSDESNAEAQDAVGAETRAALLATVLLIPPPVDIISQISDPQSGGTHSVVTADPGLSTTPTTTGAGSGGDVQIEVAPEPTGLVLGLIGSGLAAAGVWYRRLQARRQALELN